MPLDLERLEQLPLGLKIDEEPREQGQIGKAVVYNRQDWPFPSIRSGWGVDEFRYQTHQELEAQKREEKRRKKEAKLKAKQILELGGANFDPFPGSDEVTDAHKEMADKARERIGWKSEVYP